MTLVSSTWMEGAETARAGKLMPADARQRLIDNIVSSLGNGVPQRIQELQLQHFYKADPAYGKGVAKGLGLNIESVIAKAKQASAAD